MIRSLALFLASSLISAGQDFWTPELPSEIQTDLRYEILIDTKAEMAWGKLPDHPKIIWLDISNRRTRQGRTFNTLGFIAKTPGTIEFPPIPIVLEGTEFFIRKGTIRAVPNDLPKDFGRFKALWNSLEAPPKKVHLGEAIEIDFIEETRSQTRRRPTFFKLPSSRASNAQWHQFRKVEGRKPSPYDYFYADMSFFGSQAPYTEDAEIIGNEIVQTRTYRSRLYFTDLGISTGHLGVTIGNSEYFARTYLIPFSIEVLPLPPIPNNQVINTGLVGDWDFQTSITTKSILENEPFTIQIEAQGLGNPKLVNPIDLSREGFPSVKKSDDFESRMRRSARDNWRDTWRGVFSQTLIPTGKVGTYPTLTIASFDTINDEWKLSKVTPNLTLPGFTDAVAEMEPRSSLGKSLTRPVLLNLPIATFGALALAPFLPFLFGLAKKRFDDRDPERAENDRKLKDLISRFASAQAGHSEINDELYPFLRTRLKLPDGATGSEIADTLPAKDGELAEMIREHAKTAFTPRANSTDLKSLSAYLAKISFLFLLCLQSLQGSTLEEANKAFENSRFNEAIAIYDKLIEENPGHTSLHFNLAQAYLSADDTGRARAACHTSLLLDPLDSKTRALMDEIRNRQGQPALPGTSLIALRPDQWVMVATALWILAFTYLGIRHFRSLPKWPALAVITLAALLALAAAWRQQNAYSDDQYMVLVDDLPREPTAGAPDWNYSPFRAGQIVKVDKTTGTHAKIVSAESSFWLPLEHLQQVW